MQEGCGGLVMMVLQMQLHKFRQVAGGARIYGDRQPPAFLPPWFGEFSHLSVRYIGVISCLTLQQEQARHVPSATISWLETLKHEVGNSQQIHQCFALTPAQSPKRETSVIHISILGFHCDQEKGRWKCTSGGGKIRILKCGKTLFPLIVKNV